MIDLSSMRQDYGDRPFDEADVATDWTAQFEHWFADAVEAAGPEPNAMVLSTADAMGRPSSRTVLLKGYGADGFVFYSNFESRKGSDLAVNPCAGLLFPWLSLRRQVVVAGVAVRLDRADAQRYFATRPRVSQLGAWASPQSRVVRDRAELDAAYAEAERRFPSTVDTPPHWGGYRVVPDTVEFWQGRTGRVHDRLRFRRADDTWILERLAP